MTGLWKNNNITSRLNTRTQGQKLCVWILALLLSCVNLFNLSKFLFSSAKDDNNNSHLSYSWRRQQHPTLVLLPGKSHGCRSLIGFSPWSHWGLDTTERLHFDFSLSCTGEGNGNPLQCFCLENPRGGGAWWAAVYGVAQSRTQLKWLSSSYSKDEEITHLKYGA